jgi:hypothetical protein
MAAGKRMVKNDVSIFQGIQENAPSSLLVLDLLVLGIFEVYAHFP